MLILLVVVLVRMMDHSWSMMHELRDNVCRHQSLVVSRSGRILVMMTLIALPDHIHMRMQTKDETYDISLGTTSQLNKTKKRHCMYNVMLTEGKMAAQSHMSGFTLFW